MDSFVGSDGTRLVWHRQGVGRPLICLPGGPMRASVYLGDLGGLSAHRTLIRLDLRGTGASAVPDDPASYRCDRQVDDVEALRRHLGLDRMDLAGHSAGATLALLYAIRHPERVNRLVLIHPSPRIVGVEVTDADRLRVAELRQAEPWFPDAFAALKRTFSGVETSLAAIAPFYYREWTATAQHHIGQAESQWNPTAAAAFYSPGFPDPEHVRAGLARLPAPTLLIFGEYDIQVPPQHAARYAGLFPHSETAIQPQGGHYAWIDDPYRFSQTVAAFLDRPVDRSIQ